MKENGEIVVAANPCVTASVQEFYAWLLGTYLPLRFPTMFAISPASDKTQPAFHNLVTDESHPLIAPTDPVAAFSILGGLVDDDFLLLLPAEDGDGYRLQGFVTCFPNGFNTKEKLGLRLREIHAPVPGYKKRLELSMDRFFGRVEVGWWGRRVNVSALLARRVWSLELGGGETGLTG